MVQPTARVCGGSLNTASATVSADGANIFVPSATAVRMYSSLTGDRVLELQGHAADVTAICVDPANTEQVQLPLHISYFSVVDAGGDESVLYVIE